MRDSLFIFAALLCSIAAVPLTEKSTKSYIIKLKPHGSQYDVISSITERNAREGTDVNKLKYKYNPTFFNGLAGSFSDDFITDLKKNQDIEYIEEDGLMHAIGTQAHPPSWGETRVSERTLDLKQPYTYYDSAGAGVDVWVVDTGIATEQKDFEKRAVFEKSFVADEEAKDMNGHGTHCAGTIASKSYGIAKKANLHAVKVLNADGSGQFSDVVNGIQYVTSNVKPGKTVLSMSVGGPKSQAVDDAAKAAYKAGVVMIVAAGNDGDDACNGSPSGVQEIFVVGATDKTDTMADFSNYGKCVDIFAPGVDITSLWIGANGKTNTISGTSMATPHVAGVAALLMGEKKYSSAQDVYDDLLKAATDGVIKQLAADSPNKLLYNKLPTKTVDPTPPETTTTTTDEPEPTHKPHKKPHKPHHGDDNTGDDDANDE
jgi:hypothetical protein